MNSIYTSKYIKEYHTVLLDIMTRRRKIDSESVGERITTSLRLPVELLERIDHAWKDSDKYTGRTHFIESACNYYLDCEPCPTCGALNYSTAKICSSCESKLEPYQEILQMIQSLVNEYDDYYNQIISCKDEFDDLYGKIKWHLDKIDPKKREIVSELISPHVSTITSNLESINHYLEYYDIFSKDSSSVPQDFVRKKFPDLDVHDIALTYLEKGVVDISLSLLDDMHDDLEYSLINFFHHSAKRLLSNPDIPNKHFQTYSQLSRLRYSLWDKRLKVSHIKDAMYHCLAVLKNIEKTIDIVNKNLNN